MNAAIVTGAAGAIGRAIALALAPTRPIVCVDLAGAAAETVAAVAEQGGRALPCVVDLTRPDAAAAVLATAEQLGGADLLVNNAGITRDARATKMSEQDFRAVVRVNAVAPLQLATAVAPRLADGGSVVNIASRAAFGNFGQANYVSAKAALAGATRALSLTWAPRLRVNCVAPGLVRTPMTEGMPPEVMEKLVRRIPQERPAEPGEIAAVVDFLASREASYVTGQMLVACGGRSIAG